MAINASLRDSLMAQNILYYVENNPNKKNICWGATLHFANNLSKLKAADSTLTEFKPAGYYLKQSLKNKLLSIGFVDVGQLSSTDEFLENIELSTHEKAIITFKNCQKEGYSTFIGKDEFRGDYPFGDWSYVLDYGIIINSSKNITIQGTTVDKQTKSPLPFVSIQLLGTSKGTISNENGYFEFNIKELDFDKSILFSHMGYEKLELKSSRSSGEISLIPSLNMLKELTITDEGNNSKDILKKVVAQHIDEAYQKPVSFECYYFTKDSVEGLLNEAALRVFRQEGYVKSPFKPSTILNKNIFNKQQAVVPWPVHTFAEADFLPNQRLLDAKFMKKLVVDSVRVYKTGSETLTHLYFHKLGGKEVFSGQLIFDTQTLKLKEKHLSKTIKNGLRYDLYSYKMSYFPYNGYLFPKIATMEYDLMIEGVKYKGKNVFIVNEINMENPKRILFPIYDIEKAPSNKRFWKKYNKVVFDKFRVESDGFNKYE